MISFFVVVEIDVAVVWYQGYDTNSKKIKKNATTEKNTNRDDDVGCNDYGNGNAADDYWILPQPQRMVLPTGAGVHNNTAWTLILASLLFLVEYNVRLTTLDVWLRLRFLLIIAVHTVVGNHLANTVLRSDPIACWLCTFFSFCFSCVLCSVLCYVLFVFVCVCLFMCRLFLKRILYCNSICVWWG